MANLIDPRIAGAVARRFSGEPTIAPHLLDELHARLATAVPRSEELVAELSGIPAPAPVRWALVGRGQWAEANIRGMTSLIAPLQQKIAGRLDHLPLPARVAQRLVVSSEVGIMLGYVSRRVLGQYDVLVPESELAEVPRWKQRRDPAAGASLLFVGPNMLQSQEKMGFVADDFTLWVAVHEVTHRFQFAGVPWLRARFFGLIQRYLDALHMDPKSFARRLAGAARRIATRSATDEDRSAVYLLASEEQRAILDEMQALMAVVEGHGNYVMDAVSEDVIPSVKRMRHLFERRRQQSNLVQRTINHAIGLEMKLKQYEMGQHFCEAVVARGGRAALGRLWEAPENLPNLTELQDPDTWVARVA